MSCAMPSVTGNFQNTQKFHKTLNLKVSGDMIKELLLEPPVTVKADMFGKTICLTNMHIFKKLTLEFPLKWGL